MTYLKDILPNRGELVSMLEQGYVRKQVHPTEPLFILNYTQKAMFDGVWNMTTRTCRGLIVNSETYEVVARPFAKFFNWGEDSAPFIELTDSVTVSDKLDGSLGIMYWQPKAKKYAIATRGSFTSEQAVHGTELLDKAHGFSDQWRTGDTMLFEIVYPENRIVLDYGQRDELVFLATVNNKTGAVFPVHKHSATVAHALGVGCAEHFGEMTFAEALAREPRPNAEGIVLVTHDGFRMVKVKQSDYIALHRTISKLSARSIWEALGEHKSPNDIKFGLPEEFWPFIDATASDLMHDFANMLGGATQVYSTLLKFLDHEYGQYQWGRKEFAQHAAKFDCRSLLFLLLDERDIKPVVWKSLKPAADGPFFNRGEDVA